MLQNEYHLSSTTLRLNVKFGKNFLLEKKFQKNIIVIQPTL